MKNILEGGLIRFQDGRPTTPRFLKSLNLSLGPAHTSCSPIECGCEFMSGFGIDMIGLRNYNMSVNFTGGEINLRLCRNVTISNFTDCNSTSLYILKYDGKNVTSCQNLGLYYRSSFIWDRMADEPYIEYNYNGTKSQIQLICDLRSTTPKLYYTSNVQDKIIKLELVSKDVCQDFIYPSDTHSGTNVVAVLFIIALVLFLLYMLGGMLVMKYLRGAEGIEIVPNHEFWMSLPTKMKNGLIFCAGGCKSPPTYDRI